MRSRFAVLVSALLLPSASLLAQAAFPDHCQNGTPLPFGAIKHVQPIDATCGIEGKTSSPANSHLQNKVKNNFCATGKPEVFTSKMLIDLQGKTQVPSGHLKEPADRKPLQALGEGKVVRMMAHLIEAHHADVGTGESVNCGGLAEPDNDVHIALGPDAATKECNGVTAEISPHFRPESWNQIGFFEVYDKSTGNYVVNPGQAARLQGHPYRITGQLFFDASHEPCPCGSAPNCHPIRPSVWEIHPVYNIEVCTAPECTVDSDAGWESFDTWWKTLAPLQPPAKPHKHAPHEKP